MRKFIVSILVSGLMLFISCGDMLENIQPYLDEGETIYVGRIDSFRVHPGNYRVELHGFMPYGITQTGCVIKWVNPEGDKDSMMVEIKRQSADDSIKIIVDNLIEGQHDFTITTFDKQGNRSIPSTTTGYVYGDIYTNSLFNRTINGLSILPSQTSELPPVDTLLVSWSYMNAGGIGCEVLYETESGDGWGELYTSSEDSETKIVNYKPNGILKWRGLYLPEKNMLDTFYTKYNEMEIP